MEYDTRIHARLRGNRRSILELELVRNERHRNTEQDFNFRGLVSLQGKRFQ